MGDEDITPLVLSAAYRLGLDTDVSFFFRPEHPHSPSVGGVFRHLIVDDKGSLRHDVILKDHLLKNVYTRQDPPSVFIALTMVHSLPVLITKLATDLIRE